MHYYDIRIMDRATVDGNEFILLKIVSGGDYKLSINFNAKNGEELRTLHSMISQQN